MRCSRQKGSVPIFQKQSPQKTAVSSGKLLFLFFWTFFYKKGTVARDVVVKQLSYPFKYSNLLSTQQREFLIFFLFELLHTKGLFNEINHVLIFL